MRSRRALASVLLAAIATLGTAFAPAAVGAAGNGALWHVFTYIHCDEETCGGSGVLPPWISTLMNPFNAVTDGSGNFYHHATIIAIGRPGHPHRCNRTLFDQPFSGRCEVKDFGVGYIAHGGVFPNKKDFWVTSETARFNGGPWKVDPFAPYPIDTSQVAYPGHYSETQLLGSDVPGVDAYMDVTRRPK